MTKERRSWISIDKALELIGEKFQTDPLDIVETAIKAGGVSVRAQVSLQPDAKTPEQVRISLARKDKESNVTKFRSNKKNPPLPGFDFWSEWFDEQPANGTYHGTQLDNASGGHLIFSEIHLKREQFINFVNDHYRLPETGLKNWRSRDAIRWYDVTLTVAYLAATGKLTSNPPMNPKTLFDIVTSSTGVSEALIRDEMTNLLQIFWSNRDDINVDKFADRDGIVDLADLKAVLPNERRTPGKLAKAVKDPTS